MSDAKRWDALSKEELGRLHAAGFTYPWDLRWVLRCIDDLATARAEVERLKAEIAEWQKIGPNVLKVMRLGDADNARLREALRKYGRHTPGGCLAGMTTGPCTCGLDAALSAHAPDRPQGNEEGA